MDRGEDTFRKKCKIAEELQYYVYATFPQTDETKDETKSFKVYVEEIVPTEIAVGDTVDVNVDRYQKVWYTFEVPEDGRYSFTTDETAVAAQCELYVSTSIANSPTDVVVMPCNDFPLSARDKVTVAVYYETKKETSEETVPDSASFKFSLTKTEVKELQSDETTVELEAGAWSWYSYTAAKTAEYTFSAENADVEVYRTITQETSSENKLLAAESETVYVRIQNSSGEKKEIRITVTSVETISMEMDAELEVSFSEDEVANGINTKWVAFKIPESGYYVFTKVAGEATAQYFDGEKYDSDMSTERFLCNGKTVYVQVVNTSGTAASATLKATKGSKEFSCEIISLDKEKTTVLEKDQKCYYEFTAPSAGYYVFYSTRIASATSYDSYGTLYDSALNRIAYNDDGNGGNNFKIEQWIEENETVFLEVRGFGYRALKCNVGVKAK